MKKLWKSTIVIWSEFDPQEVSMDDLAREAICGEAYCSCSTAKFIENPVKDIDWDGTEFFGVEDV